MSDITVARRYARALYEEAHEQGDLERVDEDVDLIRATLDGSDELKRFFESPIIGRDKKRAVVEELFADRVHSVTHHFLQLLIDKKREALVPPVMHAYGDLRDEQLGIVVAHARAAQSLDADEERELVAQLEQMTGKRVRLKSTVVPELIGGLVVRIGDTVYDGSVRHQLEMLRERMATKTMLKGTGV